MSTTITIYRTEYTIERDEDRVLGDQTVRAYNVRGARGAHYALWERPDARPPRGEGAVFVMLNFRTVGGHTPADFMLLTDDGEWSVLR